MKLGEVILDKQWTASASSVAYIILKSLNVNELGSNQPITAKRKEKYQTQFDAGFSLRFA